MAKQYYEVNKPIQSMTTRQLRKYISDKATEAQERIDTAPDNPTKSFLDAKKWITDKSGTHVKRDTSRLTKAEMVEMAYNLREFNYTDFESGRAKQNEWTKNKKKYEAFVRDMWESDSKADRQYWEQYKTKTGRVSKKGFDDYMDFLQNLVSARGFIEQFGYEEVKYWSRQLKTEAEHELLREVMQDFYSRISAEGSEYHPPKDVLTRAFRQEFKTKLKDLRADKTAGSSKPEHTPKKPTKPKSTSGKQKSTNTIKPGKPRKMKEYGKVHRTSS